MNDIVLYKKNNLSLMILLKLLPHYLYYQHKMTHIMLLWIHKLFFKKDGKVQRIIVHEQANQMHIILGLLEIRCNILILICRSAIKAIHTKTFFNRGRVVGNVISTSHVYVIFKSHITLVWIETMMLLNFFYLGLLLDLIYVMC
jgi:hypothetical protein